MQAIRVLLANHPIMVPEVIRDLLAQQSDMELVGDCRGPMKILQEAGRLKADAIIIAKDGANEPGLCSLLLAVYPDLTLFVIASDMKTACIQQLYCRHDEIEDLETKNIMETFRTAINSARNNAS